MIKEAIAAGILFAACGCAVQAPQGGGTGDPELEKENIDPGQHQVQEMKCGIDVWQDEARLTEHGYQNLVHGSLVKLTPNEFCSGMYSTWWGMGDYVVSAQENGLEGPEFVTEVGEHVRIWLMLKSGENIKESAFVDLDVRNGTTNNNQQPITDIHSKIKINPSLRVSIQQRLRIEIHALFNQRYLRFMDVYEEQFGHVLWTLATVEPSTMADADIIMDQVRDNDDMLVYDRGNHLEPNTYYSVKAEVYNANGDLVTLASRATFFVTE